MCHIMTFTFLRNIYYILPQIPWNCILFLRTKMEISTNNSFCAVRHIPYPHWKKPYIKTWTLSNKKKGTKTCMISNIWEDSPWWLSHQIVRNFCPSLCPHCGVFNHIWSILILSSEPIGRGKSLYEKIW